MFLFPSKKETLSFVSLPRKPCWKPDAEGLLLHGSDAIATTTTTTHLCYSQVLMGKREKTYLFVRLVSAAGTGFFYVARKSRKGNMAQQKLEFRKYDPRVNRHVLFTEAKMK
ncbi:hypothetical protein AAC387_Pa09g0434 [Persea americana]